MLCTDRIVKKLGGPNDGPKTAGQAAVVHTELLPCDSQHRQFKGLLTRQKVMIGSTLGASDMLASHMSCNYACHQPDPSAVWLVDVHSLPRPGKIGNAVDWLWRTTRVMLHVHPGVTLNRGHAQLESQAT